MDADHDEQISLDLDEGSALRSYSEREATDWDGERSTRRSKKLFDHRGWPPRGLGCSRPI